MTTRFYPSARDRAGNVTVFAALLTIVFAAMVAFAVDLGYLSNSKTELQRTADAAALASAADLMYHGQPGTPVNLTSGIASAQTDAVTYAGRNPICSASPSLNQAGDVVIGYMADPRQPGATLSTDTTYQNMFNAVQVTVNRTEKENGLVPYAFARIFGMTGQSASSSATAALISNAGGFQIPSGTTNYMLPILPFALDLGTFQAMTCGSYVDGYGLTDSWCWDSTLGLGAGSDGVWECNLFPQGTGSPGNRGTVNINVQNNSTDYVKSQILNGISATDLATQTNGEIVLGTSGTNTCTLSGNPGISAGFESALGQIKGQTRIIPIFKSVAFGGNNAEYTICGWCGVRVCAVNLSGAMTSKYLTVQPANVCVQHGLVPNTSGTPSSYAVYSPVWLVK